MRRSLVSLIVGIALAVVAVVLMYNYIENATRGRVALSAVQASVGTVVVAAQNLPFGTEITPKVLRVVSWPKPSIPEGAFTKVDDIFAGAKVPGDRIALGPIARDEPITRAKISGFGGKPTLSQQVPNGMRAVSISVDAVVGVSGFVLPGDRVDILLTRPVGTSRDNLVTNILLQDITILGVDQTADTAADKPIVARTATVEVTPEQAQKLTLAQKVGTLTLTLRGVETAGLVTSPPVTEADLGGGVRRSPGSRPAGPSVRLRYGDAPVVVRTVRP